MAYDLNLIAQVGASSLLIALIVWLMYRHAIAPEWSEISKQARAQRRAKEMEK